MILGKQYSEIKEQQLRVSHNLTFLWVSARKSSMELGEQNVTSIHIFR